MKKQNAFKRKILHNGSYSIFISLAVIAVIVIFNLLISALPAGLTEFDFSEQKMFSISDQTKKLVGSLEEDVTLYYVVQSGSEDSVIEDLIDKYAGLSKHIRVEKIDPAVNPAFSSAYTANGITDNSIVVESKQRFQVVFNDSIYVTTSGYDSNGNQVSSQTFEGESALTSAIDYVTNSELPVIYTLTGHTEKAFSDRLQSYIAKENIEVIDISLITAGLVPEDCGCLVINAPERDISSEEKDMIMAYLDEGGNLLYIKDYSLMVSPNMDEITQKYGIEIENSVVFEGDSGFTYSNYSYMIIPNFSSHTITEPLIENRMFCIVPYALRIRLTDAGENYEQAALLSTTSSGYAKDMTRELETLERESQDEKGSMILAAASQNLENSGKMVVISSMDFLDETISSYVSDGNYDFVINAIGWMCEHESSIAIHAKSLSGDALNISSRQANIWSIVLTGVIPMLIIATGIIVWVIRRRK